MYHLILRLSCGQILSPWLGEIVDYGIGLSYRPVRLHIEGWRTYTTTLCYSRLYLPKIWLLCPHSQYCSETQAYYNSWFSLHHPATQYHSTHNETKRSRRKESSKKVTKIISSIWLCLCISWQTLLMREGGVGCKEVSVSVRQWGYRCSMNSVVPKCEEQIPTKHNV